MKVMRKTSDAGLGPLIPAVLAPPEVMTQAPQGFIPPPLNPTGARLDTQDSRRASTACCPASCQSITVALWWARMVSS
jgi:hypothetical protein